MNFITNVLNRFIYHGNLSYLVICLHLWFCSFTSCTHSSRGPAKSKMKQGMWAKMSTHQYLTAKSTGLIGNYLLKPSMFILKEIYCRKIKEWFRNAITRKTVAVNAPSMNFHFHYTAHIFCRIHSISQSMDYCSFSFLFPAKPTTSFCLKTSIIIYISLTLRISKYTCIEKKGDDFTCTFSRNQTVTYYW